ncbi:hypothetical protein [Pseudorhodobacter sp.]|uniref:hypothetical protein n=1 Tax=Pseudorhodobacter sp. TaxID=1934400 RepID=UPI0026486B6D|nr:hypothetical protein [Pseudorhodobacter sp.]MDN5787159.1 hypothetical protein [Pseudorhodobacter sp.]
MRIVYHLGAHCTDEERLLRCLLKNRGRLAEEGIVVPGPAKYRSLLRDTAMSLKGEAASEETQTMIMEQIMSENRAERVILSWDNFMGFAPSAVRGGIYTSGPDRMHAFCQIFPGVETEFHLAIRNPATFVPAMFHKQKGRAYEDFIEGMDVASLRWSTLISALRERNPQVPITVWCDEDTPLLWPEILRAVSGHSDKITLTETDDLLASIMSADGMGRMAGYIESHPPQDATQRRRVVSAFLDKFALTDQVEVEIDMPGWSEDLIAGMTEGYDQDVSRIIAMDGVHFLTA